MWPNVIKEFDNHCVHEIDMHGQAFSCLPKTKILKPEHGHV